MNSIKKINKHLSILEQYVEELIEAKENIETRVDNLTRFLLKLGYTRADIDKTASSGTAPKSIGCLHTLQEEKLRAYFTRKVTPCEMAKLDQFNIDEECIPTARVIDFCVVDIDGVATEVTDFNTTYKTDIRINGKQVYMSLNDINLLDEDMCK